MKVTMREYYQDARMVLEPGKVYDVDSQLGAWLVRHYKATEVITEKNFLEPVTLDTQDARHLDVEPQFEQAEEPPRSKAKRGKK